MTTQDDALLLIAAIEKGFRRGVRYYDQTGKQLYTVEQVVLALLDGPVEAVELPAEKTA